MGKCLKVFSGHNDEVLDISFNSTGTKLATASADSTCKIYNVAEAECVLTLEGTILLIKATTKMSQR
jgi:dynein assembly factor with WDR repeat domains 1